MFRILAVTMLYKYSGREQFYVQISEEEEKAVMIYRVFDDGSVIPLRERPYTLVSVTSAVEKFNAGYYVENPVEFEDLNDLVDLACEQAGIDNSITILPYDKLTDKQRDRSSQRNSKEIH